MTKAGEPVRPAGRSRQLVSKDTPAISRSEKSSRRT